MARTLFVAHRQSQGTASRPAGTPINVRAARIERVGFAPRPDPVNSRRRTPVADEEVIVLRKYSSEVEATMAHLVLEAHNIPSAVMRDNAGGMIPSMALIYPVRLAVRREDAEEARRILDAEAPLQAEDGGEELIEEPNSLLPGWSPERDRDDDHLLDDPEEDPERDRRW